MEETLRDLERAMAEHRRAMAETRMLPADAAARQDRAADARRRVVERLARDIERVSGIEITGLIEAKLARVLASVDPAALAAWAGRLRLLPADDPEWLSLIEALTVHETFFHRDRAQLALLMQVMAGIIAAAVARRRPSLRLWSAGCATGEEAYTLAVLALLVLREAGLADDAPGGGIVCRAGWRVEVLGTDISRLVMAQAQAAVYSSEGLNPFRDLPRELQRFFPALPPAPETGGPERRGVLAAVRRHVRFRQFNLMAGSPPDTGFDIVLCRNVLIYLTAAARTRAQRVLRQALRPGGYLLLGPTDALAEPALYEARWGAAAVAYALKPGR